MDRLAAGGLKLTSAYSQPTCTPTRSAMLAGRLPARTGLTRPIVSGDKLRVKALEETGQIDKTLIFVTSDNGPQMDSWPDSGYTPFRGAKGSNWEGGVRVPAIAYWPGMIAAGRQSDDLFDLTDMFLTTLGVAGVADKVPTDRYIDSIDQTGFLLADKGRSHRDKIFYWDGADFRGIRMLEYKAHYSLVETKADNLDIDQSIVTKPSAPWLFNLYIDPKESHAVGHRMNAFLGALNQEVKAHLDTFRRFPPKKTGL
jgi:arylsulfatase